MNIASEVEELNVRKINVAVFWWIQIWIVPIFGALRFKRFLDASLIEGRIAQAL